MLRASLFAAAIVVVVCLSATAHSEEVPTQAPGWDTSEFQLGEDGPCTSELVAASVLIRRRDSGESKDKVISTLPAKDQTDHTPSSSITHSVLDDVYGNPAVARFPYFVYRNITCMRRYLGKQTPVNFSSVAPQVMACQKKFGVAASDHLISCIQAVVVAQAS